MPDRGPLFRGRERGQGRHDGGGRSDLPPRENPGYPKTICAVVYNGAPSYGCQFSFACDGSRVRPRSLALWKATWKLAGELLKDREAVLAADTTLGALRFHADYVQPDWEAEGFEMTVQIGRHIFYRPKAD